MSHSNRKRYDSKKLLKTDKNDFIKSIIVSPKSESNNNIDNDFSIFNIKNVDLINNSNFEEKKLFEQENFDNSIKEKDNNQADSYNYNLNYLFRCISSPDECHSMPLIMINPNKNTVSSQCPANGQSNELTNPHEPDEITEIPIKNYIKKIYEFYNSIKCAKCKKEYEPNMSSKNNNKSRLSEDEEEEEEEEEGDDKKSFFLCYSCNKYYCKDCKEEHIKLYSKNDSSLSDKHFILSVDKLSCYCLYHKEKNFGYCHNCKQNICIKCVNNKRHNSHDIVLFKNILINSKEVSEIKKKINIEKKNLNFFESIFMENWNNLKKQFYALLENKKEICKLKEFLINEYEKKSFNYQMIMACLKMEFNTKNITIFKKIKDENSLDVISLIFDTLNEKIKYTYRKSKPDILKKKEKEKEKEREKEKEKEKEKEVEKSIEIQNRNKKKEKDINENEINNDNDSDNNTNNKNKININIINNTNDNINNNLENNMEEEIKLKIKKKKLADKRKLLKSFSNSVSISDINENENNNNKENKEKKEREMAKSVIKKDNSNNSLLNNSNSFNSSKNQIKVRTNSSLNNSKDKKDRTDISRNIFNKKLLINNLPNKPIKEEKPKEDETEEDDDLLFFPKRSVKVKEQPIYHSKTRNKNPRKLGEEFINSQEKDKRAQKEKTKSPKYRKNKIYIMKRNENNSFLKDLILDDIQNKGELFSSLKVNYTYNNELFGDENDSKNIKRNSKVNNNEKEKEYENENDNDNDNENEMAKSNNNIKNIINKDISKKNTKRKEKKKLVVIKNEFSESNDDNLNINLEKETNSVKDESESKHQNKINIFLNSIGHLGNNKINTISLNDSGSIMQNNNIKMSNIKKYQQRTKNKNKEFGLPPLKYSQDNVQFSSTEKNKKNLSLSTFKEAKSNDEKEEESENDENEEDEDSYDSSNKNKYDKKNNKAIKVPKNFLSSSNKSIPETNEILIENFMKTKKDNKGRVYSIKIANDPVWCILSMKNNEYLSVGLASGIIRIFSQNEFNQKLCIEEHSGAIYSMYLTKKNSNCFLTSSTDNLIKKILISDNFTSYSVLAVLKGHNSSVYKAIELNSYLILSCSDDGYLFIWENMNKNQINDYDDNIKNNEDMNEDNNLMNNNNASYSVNLNKINFVNDFLSIKKDNNNINTNNNNSNIASKKNILNKVNSELIFEMNNKYQITKKLNQVLNRGEVVYDILQINQELFVTSSLYGYLRFWDINSMTNTDIIKEIQCNDSHNCLCMINRTVIGVLLNEKYGIALVDYIKKEVSHKIIVDKDLEIKLSTILLTSNKLVVIGGQNNGSSEESQVIYKFYKIIKVKKANSTNFKYSLKFLNAHVKKSQKLLADDDVWLNAMAEGSNGTIINGLGSTNMNKEFGQIDIFFREIKNKNIKEVGKESQNSFSDYKNKK